MKEKGIHDMNSFALRGSMMDSFRDSLCHPVQEKVSEPVVNTVNKHEVCALAKIFNKI